MAYVNYSNSVREILRSIPLFVDERKNKTGYALALANAIGCNKSLVTKEIKSLNDEVNDRYSFTPLEFIRKDKYSFNTLLQDADINSNNVFKYWAVYLVNSERYGKSCTKDLIALDKPESSDHLIQFLKNLAKKHKRSLIDEILEISKQLGMFDAWVSIEYDELLHSEEYDYKHFPLDASMTYLDNYCRKFGVIREVLEAARKQVIDNHALAESEGIEFVDYNTDDDIPQELEELDDDSDI